VRAQAEHAATGRRHGVAIVDDAADQTLSRIGVQASEPLTAELLSITRVAA